MAAPRDAAIDDPAIARVVCAGLSRPQKALPSYLLYDRRGSELFEAITKLEEYYPTSCEEEILLGAADEIAGLARETAEVVEFGSGSGAKTRLLLGPLLEARGSLAYVPIDISEQFLLESAQALREEHSGLEVRPLAAEYGQALAMLGRAVLPRLFVFLGSNIGNFDPDTARSFLAGVRQSMGPGDLLLVGIDLVKDQAIIESAYNDRSGVTAEFNKNILGRINRELGGAFELETFEHWAPYLPRESKVEMRLVSMTDQVVPVAALSRSFAFARGEYIHTEDSHKYTPGSFDRLVNESGLRRVGDWSDSKGWFADVLLRRHE